MKKITKIERKNRTDYVEIEQNTPEAIVTDVCGVGIVALCMGAIVKIYGQVLTLIENQ